MTKPPPKEVIAFERPMISPRLYSARGPSGWLETFSRRELDAELAGFLGSVEIDDAASLFVKQREVSEDKDPENWHTVIGFLGRLVGISPLDVPSEAAIAFWAHVELARRARGAN